MNYVTADVVVSLYPKLTFNKKAAALNACDHSTKRADCIRKYAARGADVF